MLLVLLSMALLSSISMSMYLWTLFEMYSTSIKLLRPESGIVGKLWLVSICLTEVSFSKWLNTLFPYCSVASLAVQAVCEE